MSAIYPLQNASFEVNIGNRSYGFSRIKNITETIEVEPVQEGGNNWTVHNLAKPITSSHKLVLERVLWPDIEGDPDLTAGARLHDVTIMVMYHGKIMKSYSFKEGIVTRWDLSDLDALQGQIILNTIEILHSGLYEK